MATLTDANDVNEDQSADAPKQNERLVIGVSVSAKLGAIVEKYASDHNCTVAAVARQALAKFLDYNLAEEPASARGARTKYASKEEAAEAQKKKVAERNELIKILLADYRAKQAAAQENGTELADGEFEEDDTEEENNDSENGNGNVTKLNRKRK